MAKPDRSNESAANAAANPPGNPPTVSEPGLSPEPRELPPEPRLGGGASPAGLGNFPPRANPAFASESPAAQRAENARDESKRAVLQDGPEELVCRPPVGVPTHLLGDVVIGNWRGHVGKKAISVGHGTPVAGLPPEVLAKLRETPEQKIGPFDGRKKNEPPQFPQ